MKLIRHLYMIKYSLIFYFFVSTCLYAVEVNDLYQAKVPVVSQALEQRNKALQQVMKAVMVKVGGQENIFNNNVIKQALRYYQPYVSQYSYVRDNGDLYLQVSFDEEKINQLFQQAQLPLWGSLRPQVLLWLVEEDKLSRNILSASADGIYPRLIQNYSRTRGLPIMLPLMDLTDSEQIKLADIWGRFSQPVSQASSRYGAEAVVIVRISNSSLLAVEQVPKACLLCTETLHALDWTLLTTEQRFNKSYQGVDRKILVEQALSDITDIIYQHYALSTESNNEFVIDVANVGSVIDYIAITEFLAEHSSVKSVALLSAKGSKRRFKLRLLGSQQALLSSLKLNKQLQQYIDPLAEIIPDAIPVFHWGNL